MTRQSGHTGRRGHVREATAAIRRGHRHDETVLGDLRRGLHHHGSSAIPYASMRTGMTIGLER